MFIFVFLNYTENKFAKFAELLSLAQIVWIEFSFMCQCIYFTPAWLKTEVSSAGMFF